MIYIPWWFQCNLTADCSINDLCLLKDINEFTGFDEAIAQKAIKSFLTIYLVFNRWINSICSIQQKGSSRN